ncbi:MAG TPA: glycosyltransferase [Ferruginibacter sp.]|nr:glycosyltransferase [Ferruginibacter sp.]
MKPKNINRLVVLVAPLDWGLGHATRCIPIIKALLELNCEVVAAASGAQKALLEKEFPAIRFLELEGYKIMYGNDGLSTRLRLIGQIPKIFRMIRREFRWLKITIEKEGIDLVISDNRMGLNTKSVPCIYITHQLQIQTGNRFFDKLAQKLHYRFINRFQECWVPDYESGKNLAGALSHPVLLPKATLKYLGPLSRFRKNEQAMKYDVAIILSGPEPQRSILEKIICEQARLVPGKKLILIRGLPLETKPLNGLPDNLEHKNHLGGKELNDIIGQSDLVIGRCGYSTVMDLAVLGKKAVLIPTPGQTEQEYLAKHLAAGNLFCCMQQEGFSLKAAIESGRLFPFRDLSFPGEEFRSVIGELVMRLSGDQQSKYR